MPTKKVAKSEAIRRVYAPPFVVVPFFALLGAFVSVATFVMSHRLFPAYNGWSKALVGLIIVCGLAYSVPTVKDIATVTFRSEWKAWAFTLLLEAIMVTCPMYISLFALGFMAIANAYVAAVSGLNQFTKPVTARKKRK